ncbi:FAD-binding oxidoreductase [Mycobacterium sp. 141]|uniref:NAD(P)/FAD-dependent oxidoreductase n=1 Tax=Mycobacterium sp. 141 TaxID=1120797 RepID=UPI000369C111|nr:FAD-dependent oxidoreductase [Mycobacterium sp. 141]
MAQNYDALVIGAGVIGSSIALELARSGRSVRVLDKGPGAGHGSTSASSAIVRFNYSTMDGVATAWEAAHCWREWSEHLGGKVAEPLARFYQCGWTFLDTELAPAERAMKLFDLCGVPYEHLDAEALAARIPTMDVGQYFPPKAIEDEHFFDDAQGSIGALFTPDGGFVDDPRLAAANMADAAVAFGAQFSYRTKVVAATRDDDLWKIETDRGETIEAPVVVNAAGPWSGALNELAGVGGDFTVTVRALRQEVAHVSAPPGYNPEGGLGSAIGDLDLGIYMRPEPGGGFLVGGTEPECDPLEWIGDPDSANLNRTAAQFERQVMRAARRLPEITVPSQARGIAGVYDVSSDWAPIYDKTDQPGFYVAIGTSGNQFKTAPLVGRLMNTLITAVENGADHDNDPVHHIGEHTGLDMNIGAFSRKRPFNPDSTGTVMG